MTATASRTRPQHFQEGGLLCFGGACGNLADGLGHSEFFGIDHEELETALLEGHWPEALGTYGYAVGVACGGSVPCDKELHVGYKGAVVVLVLEEQLAFIIELEPFLLTVLDCRRQDEHAHFGFHGIPDDFVDRVSVADGFEHL